jgi:hypothetical protein
VSKTPFERVLAFALLPYDTERGLLARGAYSVCAAAVVTVQERHPHHTDVDKSLVSL